MAFNSNSETVVILDEEKFKLTEISTICNVNETLIIEFVEYGILEPLGNEPAQWIFPPHSLRRAQKAIRLSKDLEINLAGISLILELLDEMTQLRQKMDLLEK
jgi:chaperone modulatory protein CbpM